MLSIVFWQSKRKENHPFQEELIFFKLFSFGQENNSGELKQSSGPYIFKVSYKNIDFKKITLSDTIHENTLIREKIAPRTQGSFEIQLVANQKMNYQIRFEDKNSKPQNLIFEIEGKDRKYKNLKDMEVDLQGKVRENKRIIINWQWE